MWEYKFVFKDDSVARDIFGIISKMETIAGYRCYLKDEVFHNDYYFDSPDLSLESRGMVCRIRHERGKRHHELVLKRQGAGPNREVVYLQSMPLRLGKKGVKDALQGKFPGDFHGVLQIFSGSKKIEYIL